MTTTLTHNRLEPLQANGLVFAVETIGVIYEQVDAIGPQHHDEISSEGREYAPNWEALASIESNNGFRLYTARNQSTGELVGYVGYFMSMSLHYNQCKQAVAHGIYLLPEYRRGMNGANLLRYSEADLINQGVNQIFQAVTERKDYSALLERMGYTKRETTYGKRV